MMIYQKHNSTGTFYLDKVIYNDFNYVLHMHRFSEIIYVFSGELQINCGDRKDIAHAGDFAIVLGNIPHSYATKHHSKVWVGVFSDDWIPDFNRFETQYSYASVFKCDDITHEFLVQKLINGDNKDRMLLKACLYTAMDCYNSSADWHDRNDIYGSMQNQMLMYISEQYKEPISSLSMAKALGYEEHYISRCFNKLIGCGFCKFLSNYRVDAAKKLLSTANMNVYEIAFECGFQSVRNFNRVFKAETGMTPREYMKSGNL